MKRNMIEENYNNAVDFVLIEVEKIARNILKKHSNLDYFIMATGTYFFVDKNKENIETYTEIYRNGGYSFDDSFSYFKPLNDLISEWDECLKLTGYSMKFTATGKIITDW